MGSHIPGITKPIHEVYDGEGDHVILLDGIAHDGRDMSTMGRFLSKAGYRAVALGYPSTKLSIEDIAGEYIPTYLEKFVPNDGRRMNFVTHSMGGIVLREYIQKQKPERLARSVMIAPPNQGSPVADQLKHIFIYKWYFGPAGQQLGTKKNSKPKALPAADFEVGVIAGNVSVDPWFDPFFDEPHDGKVAVSSTRLEGMRDFKVIPQCHYLIHRSKQACELTLNYLRGGHFGS